MSDQGSCFTGYAFAKTIRTLGLKQRLTRRRTPEHNAFIESFFAQLKREEVWPKQYWTIRDAQDSIDQYVDFYNYQRPHGRLEMKTPAQVRWGNALHKIAA